MLRSELLKLRDALGRVVRQPASDGRGRQRGQVLPIFAVMAVVMLAGAALVTDVTWWWVNQQRMQRAADAGALAGAIHLPGNPGLAFTRARDETAKNGFTNGLDGVVVTPSVDPVDPRKLIVDIDAPVETNFAKVLTMDHVDVSVVGAASYVLPVPMGSPQSYYGVGFFQGMVPGAPVLAQQETDWRPPSQVLSSEIWSNPERAYANDNSYATKRLSDSQKQQVYGGFSFAVPTDATVTGIEVRARANDSNDGGCAIDVQVDSLSGWSSPKRAVLSGPWTENTSPGTLGGASDGWGGTWPVATVNSSSFELRVTAVDPGTGCAGTDTVRLDQLEVRVHYQSEVPGPPTLGELDVPDPSTGAALDSQGFWGAIFTSGGVRENGDRYAPLYIGGNNPPDGSNGGPNPDYDANGYEYTIEVGANGQVQLFDPVFCATGRNNSGGWLGTGDHWTNDGTGGGETIGPVSVRFELWNTNGTPYTTGDDAFKGAWEHNPGSSTLGDFSGNFNRPGSNPQNYGRGDAQDCADHPAHNKWVLPSGWSNLSAGTYRLNVNTNLGQNANHGAENLFSIWTKGTGLARVYGGGRMAAYTNLDDTGAGGAQQFYFSQIDGVHAGKTMEITLFDPGEAGSDSYLRFLTPQGGTYHYATFDWASNDGRSGSGTEVQTAAPARFNNRLLTIQIALPTDYGDAGLDPDGLGEDGWWKVEYDVRAGNDTTTWEVKLIGNPVHLVLE